MKEIREIFGNEFFICMHGDNTMAIRDGENMIEVAAMMYEQPMKIIEMQENNYNSKMEFIEVLNKKRGLLDGFALCSDYAFNTNPFFSRDMFAELIMPML